MDYEKLFEVAPSEDFLLDSHPADPLVAMQVTIWNECSRERAAVWNRKTGRLVWAPESTTALCWRERGREVLLLRERYQRDPSAHGVIVTPIASEFRLTLERRSWPGKELIATCPISPPRGWLVRVAASPADFMAAYRWQDQTESGFELMFVGPKPHEIQGAGYAGQTLLDGPVFSPSGVWIAGAAGRDEAWWSPDPEDPTVPSRGGHVAIGTLVIGDVEHARYTEVQVTADLPRGWLPIAPESLESQFIRAPRFLDAERLELRFPTGEEVACQVSDLLRLKSLHVGSLRVVSEAERRAAEQKALAAAVARTSPIDDYNIRASRLVKDLAEAGFTCPHCHKWSYDFIYHPGTDHERALIVCNACSRSCGPDSYAASPGAQPLLGDETSG